MRIGLWLCAIALCIGAGTVFAQDTEVKVGESIYRLGLLPGNKALRGFRGNDGSIEGAAAACINCHRSSGLGTTEGQIVVPPIIGKYLFRAHSTNVQDMSLSHVAGYRSTRQPYGDATLAQAIREGHGPNGRALNYLMPRYELDDVSMEALAAYLKSMGTSAVPGVSADTLHFATIITPDTDPLRRQAMLDVMQRFFADKNEFIRGGIRPMQATREIEYRVSRRWQLHVWQLQGEPDTWEQQLHVHLMAEPVYAVISGLGGKTWAPVHRFCQSEQLPCLLPNVDLPVVAENDFYPVYFSRGVLLDADLMAKELFANTSEQRPRVRRLVQVFRRSDVGEAASNALMLHAKAAGIVVENHVLQDHASNDASAFEMALRGLGNDDALALWLRPADLQALPKNVPELARVLVSGTMGGLEQAPLPVNWRSAARIAYPVDLPDLRRVRMNFPLNWFKIKHIALVDERLQTDTYVACGVLAETLTDMLDSFVRDYLVERLEGMVSHRLVNGYYPRLGLASGQRFASKGGYIARFAGSDGVGILADGDWLVP
jgi:cytochrome c553